MKKTIMQNTLKNNDIHISEENFENFDTMLAFC